MGEADEMADNNCPICKAALAAGAAVCPSCGYRVQGATESFKPVKVGSADDMAPAASQQRDLRVVRGPQTGMDISLREGTLSLGRDPRCDIFLNDMTVSRTHAEIEVGAGGCILRDANSFNGVWVNDRSIDACLLKPGDVIQIGAFCLVYRERS